MASPRCDETRAALDLSRLQILQRASQQAYLKDRQPSDEELRAEYDIQVAQLGTTEYRASQILLDTEDAAKKIIAQLKAGANFAQLAKPKSMDARTRDKGGDLDWFTRQPMARWCAVIKRLKKGETTPEPVKTQYGWHVITAHRHARRHAADVRSGEGPAGAAGASRRSSRPTSTGCRPRPRSKPRRCRRFSTAGSGRPRSSPSARRRPRRIATPGARAARAPRGRARSARSMRRMCPRHRRTARRPDNAGRWCGATRRPGSSQAHVVVRPASQHQAATAFETVLADMHLQALQAQPIVFHTEDDHGRLVPRADISAPGTMPRGDRLSVANSAEIASASGNPDNIRRSETLSALPAAIAAGWLVLDKHLRRPTSPTRTSIASSSSGADAPDDVPEAQPAACARACRDRLGNPFASGPQSGWQDCRCCNWPTAAAVDNWQDTLAALRADPDGGNRRARPAREGLAYTPSDPLFTGFFFYDRQFYDYQWYLRGGQPAAIRADVAWDITRGGASPATSPVVVAVVDSGVRPDHPELAGKLLPDSTSFPAASAARPTTATAGMPIRTDPGDFITAAGTAEPPFNIRDQKCGGGDQP